MWRHPWLSGFQFALSNWFGGGSGPSWVQSRGLDWVPRSVVPRPNTHYNGLGSRIPLMGCFWWLCLWIAVESLFTISSFNPESVLEGWRTLFNMRGCQGNMWKPPFPSSFQWWHCPLDCSPFCEWKESLTLAEVRVRIQHTEFGLHSDGQLKHLTHHGVNPILQKTFYHFHFILLI